MARDGIGWLQPLLHFSLFYINVWTHMARGPSMKQCSGQISLSHNSIILRPCGDGFFFIVVSGKGTNTTTDGK